MTRRGFLVVLLAAPLAAIRRPDPSESYAEPAEAGKHVVNVHVGVERGPTIHFPAGTREIDVIVGKSVAAVSARELDEARDFLDRGARRG